MSKFNWDKEYASIETELESKGISLQEWFKTFAAPSYTSDSCGEDHEELVKEGFRQAIWFMLTFSEFNFNQCEWDTEAFRKYAAKLREEAS